MKAIDGNFTLENKILKYIPYDLYDYGVALELDGEKHLTFRIPSLGVNNENVTITIFEKSKKSGNINEYYGYGLYQTQEAGTEFSKGVGRAFYYTPKTLSDNGKLYIDYQNSEVVNEFNQYKALDKVDIKILSTGEAEYYINNKFLCKRPSFIGIMFRAKHYGTQNINDFVLDDYIEINSFNCELQSNKIKVEYNYFNYAANSTPKHYLRLNNYKFIEIEPNFENDRYVTYINDVYWGMYNIEVSLQNEYKNVVSDIKTIYIVKDILLRDNDKTKNIILYEPTETDFRHNGLGRLDVLSAKLTEENGKMDLELELVNNSRSNSVVIGSAIKCRVGDERNNQLFRVRGISKTNNSIIVYCSCLLLNDVGDNYIKDVNFKDVNVVTAINNLLKNTIFKNNFVAIGTGNEIKTPVLEKKNFKNLLFDDENSIKSNYNCMLSIDNTKIIVDRENKNFLAKDRKNIIEIEQDLDDYDVCTCIIPYSSDGYGLDEVFVISQLVNNYPAIRCQEVIFQDIKISDEYPTELEIKKALRDKSIKMFENDKIDLPYLNFNLEIFENKKFGNLRLNDRVICRHKKLNIEFNAEVIKRVYDPLSDKNVSVEIGVNRKTLNEVFRLNEIKKMEKGNTAFASKKYVDLKNTATYLFLEDENLMLVENSVDLDCRLAMIELGI